ncbi:hypothetical protein EJ05DRAFT_540262 [Pseudovirgaria hyperparasitica]|uniref:Rhodopsin domain-containing protein n=1 Tax=Pseudovirgaria hyperparasitica TaxID=470096 RepID=A0A6A6VZ33_9PEZI|nr:uncharacterized protein EJ05DRAFT_540262 [Pseudovirgaria hyperparasitica]KAF2755553.1 hypothetical protein EJ05DRAFT_540262 [Pseudovirgaria hyperparasitica]
MSTTSREGMIACCTVLPVLGITVVGLRAYVRVYKQKVDLAFDDYVQPVILALYIGMCIAGLIGVSNKALGYPSPVGPIEYTAPSTILCMKLLYAIQMIQIPALGLVKIAALCFYRRMFCVHRKGSLVVIIWTLIYATILWMIGCVISYALGCGTHPTAAWGGNIPFATYCKDITLRWEVGFSVTDFVLDTLVLVVPLPSIWSLRTTFGRKLGITCVLMLALVGYGASIARMAVFIRLATGVMGASAIDIQSSDTQAIWFSQLETGLALIAVNLPTLWKLVSDFTSSSMYHSLRSLIRSSDESKGSVVDVKFGRPEGRESEKSFDTSSSASHERGGIRKTVEYDVV